MAEKYSFRSSMNGFNRNDVIAFIDGLLREKSEAELRIAVLENELNELNEDRKAIAAKRAEEKALEEAKQKEAEKEKEAAAKASKCDNCDIAKVYEARLGAAMLDAKRFSETLLLEANNKAAGMFSKAYDTADDTAAKAKDISESIVNINKQFNESFSALLENMKKLGDALELFKSDVKGTGSVFDYTSEFAPVDSIVLHSENSSIGKQTGELNFDDVEEFEIKVDV